MILLRRQKVLFLKARKVAGTSFEIALSRFAGPDDIITPISDEDEATRRALGFPGPRNFEQSLLGALLTPSVAGYRTLWQGGRPRRFFNHISAEDARRLVGRETWEACRKVAIVRNPFERVVSTFYFRHRDATTRPPFARWVEENPDVPRINMKTYLIDGRNVIDDLIRYEQLETDVRALEARVPALAGLYETFAGITAKGQSRPRSGARAAEMFAGAPGAEEIVRREARYEIDRFGYDLSQ